MFNVTLTLTFTLTSTLRCFTDVDMQFRYVKVYFQTCYSCKKYLTLLLFQASLRFGKAPKWVVRSQILYEMGAGCQDLEFPIVRVDQKTS